MEDRTHDCDNSSRSKLSVLRHLSLLPIVGSLFLPGACSEPPRATFDLNATQEKITARTRHGQLVVLLPAASLPADSDRIVVRGNAQSVAYLMGAQWVENLPSLLQSRLIESFQNAHSLRGVGGPGFLGDASLATNINRFDLDLARSEAFVEIRAQILGPNGRVTADHLFSSAVPVASSEPAAVAAALDVALSKVFQDIVVWASPKV
ncbi:MAG TPA: ABC-type transport auxiliary lipoprotein family protein [Methylocella sp.]|nr:ABC-type transport auxiliary lipoprotein family protein [Methylocella sp.]